MLYIQKRKEKMQGKDVIKHPLFSSMVQLVDEAPHNAEFLITPIEKHFATTLGHLLRRTIFHLTPGCAITSVHLPIAAHELSSLPYVKENVMQLVNHLRRGQFCMHDYGPRYLFLHQKGPKRLTLGDICLPPDVKLFNKNEYLCTLHAGADLHLRMVLESGLGLRPVNEDSLFQNPCELKMDAVFSPITHVCYHVKHFTFYEELLLHVQTDGSVLAKDAVQQAFSILCTKMHSLDT